MAEKDQNQTKEQALAAENQAATTAAPPRSPVHEPEIHLTISTSAPQYSLSSRTGIKFRLRAVLQAPSPPITIKTYETMFRKLLRAPYPDAGYFDFVNVETGKKLRRTYHTDSMRIHDPRLEELSWAHADLYAVLSPNEPYSVEHGFSPRSDDIDGFEVGKTYRIEVTEQDETARIRWWSIGTKMQVLYWFFWPLREPVHTWNRKPERPVRVVLVESCEIEIVE